LDVPHDQARETSHRTSRNERIFERSDGTPVNARRQSKVAQAPRSDA
jgi:hypothetical protein